jgi:glutamine synthetase
MERRLDPGEPALVDPDALPEAERQRRGIRRLPASLGEALDALERDELLCAALGEVLAREYLVVKRSEVQGFAGKDVAFEIDQHFYKY